MKIAFCLFKYFPYGGLQRDFFRIATVCHQRGHEIHVYTMQWEGEAPAGWHIHLLPVLHTQNHSKNAAFAEIFKKEAGREKPDVVVGFNKMPYLDVYYAADICYQSRAREKHGFLYRLLPRYQQLIELEKAVFASGKKTDILLIANKQQQEFQRYYRTETERFHLLPPGISPDRKRPANADEVRTALRAAYFLKEEDILLLMVGSGFKTKGLDRAIFALAALPVSLKKRTRLMVIGQDNPAIFQRLASKLKVENHLQFLGGRNDVPQFLLAADLLIHPAYHENTGTVLLEAMMAGLPVLTIDVCGYAHYVKNAKAGVVLSSPFRQLELNMNLEKMLSSPMKKTWQSNGLLFAETHDIYNLPEKAANLIETAAQKKAWSVPSHQELMQLRGERFREQKGRVTQRVQLNNNSYFIKQHTGAGWKEILKNIIQLRWPVLSAKPEKFAIEKLASLGIDVPKITAYWKSGINPARIRSFILMEEISPAVSLEDLCKTWNMTTPDFKLKYRLIKETARIARVMHENGVNHRDFYLCHFLLQTRGDMEKLYLIDLHRAKIWKKLPVRWKIKDLSGLYFSSKNIGLTQRDLYRFIKFYTAQSLRDAGKHDTIFWNKVKIRGEQLYRAHARNG